MIGSARALWIASPNTAEIREEHLPALAPGQVLVQTLYSAVSRGTESLVFSGKVPASEHQRMRCPHQVGEFPGPVKYGYANVGLVLEGPGHLQGRHVFSLFPHQTRYVVSESAVLPIEQGIPPERCVLAANMETAINALWDARPLLGDRVTVVGAGVVGSLCAYLLQRMSMSDVELVDLLPERERIARAFAVQFATPEAAKGDRDLLLHASGKAEGLRLALGLCASEASIIELSWYGAELVSLPLGEAFHAKRLTIRSSQVGTLSPNARSRFQYRSRLELALGLCRDPSLDVLFTSEGDFESLAQTMPELASGTDNTLCHRVRYETEVS